jgi:hypothetical protein
VLLLSVREYERLAFVSRAVSPPFFAEALGPLADLLRHEAFVERKLGFDSWIPRALRTWSGQCAQELASHHFGHLLGDSESSLEWLSRFKVLVVPSFDFMARETQEKLLAYVWGGGKLVIGPQLPTMDEAGDPCSALVSKSVDGIHVVERPEEIPAALARCGVTPLCALDNRALELAIHSSGSCTYVFVANPTQRAEVGTLRCSGLRQLRDAWGDNATLEGEGAFQLSLRPHEIQVWSC